jgi:hypothetical protein
MPITVMAVAVPAVDPGSPCSVVDHAMATTAAPIRANEPVTPNAAVALHAVFRNNPMAVAAAAGRSRARSSKATAHQTAGPSR